MYQIKHIYLILFILSVCLLQSCNRKTGITQSSPVYVKDFGAKGDGKTDDTNSIQRAISASNGLVIFDNKKYLVSSTIAIKSNIKMSGNDAEIIIPPKSGFHVFLINDAKNIDLSDFRFTGNRDSYAHNEIDKFRFYYTFYIKQAEGLRFNNLSFEEQATTCMQMIDVKEIEIENCSFKNIGLSNVGWTKKIYSYDAIFIGGEQKSCNIKIRNSTFSRIGQFKNKKRYTNDGDGIQILNLNSGNTENIFIEGCLFEECSSRGIKIQTGKNVNISKCNFNYCGSGIGMPMTKTIEQISIHNNNFTNTRLVLAVNSGASINADRIEVYNNSVQNAREFLRTSGNSLVTNSRFYNNTVNGLDLYFISGRFQNTTFEKNIIKEFARLEDPSFYMAFLLWDTSDHVKIIKNKISTSAKTHCAIYFKKGVSNSIIEGNELSVPNKTGKEKHLFHFKESLQSKSNVIRNNFHLQRKMKDYE